MKNLRITVNGKAYDVTVEDLSAPSHAAASPLRHAAASAPPPPPPVHAAPSAPAGAGEIASPMAGVVKSILVKSGDSVAAGQEVAVLEAMKMESRITSATAGSVQRIDVKEGESVTEGRILMVIG